MRQPPDDGHKAAGLNGLLPLLQVSQACAAELTAQACLAGSLLNKPDFSFFLVFLAAFGVSLLTIWLTFLNSQNRLFFASLMAGENLDDLSFGGVAEWLKAADCKSARVAYVGSNPTPTTISTRPV